MSPMTLPTLPTSTQLAFPSNHFSPSTRTRCRRAAHADVPRAGPDVGRPTEAILQRAVGVADHQRVEPGAGHHGEVLAVDHADVERVALAVRARSRPRLGEVLRDAEVRREQVGGAGGDDRERRRRPAGASMQRCTMPSPPHTNTRSAPSASALRTRFGAFFDFGTSYQRGSTTPSAASTERNSVSPPPRVLPECATTATDVTAFVPLWSPTCEISLPGWASVQTWRAPRTCGRGTITDSARTHP